jgi:hypothetical protein
VICPLDVSRRNGAKRREPRVKVIAVQPTEGHDVPDLRNVAQLDVSKLFDPSLIDEILEIDYKLAYTRAVELARREGLMAGPSSGLIYEGARRVVERDRRGFGVMIFCDNVFKYVSNFVKHVRSGGGDLRLSGRSDHGRLRTSRGSRLDRLGLRPSQRQGGQARRS